MTTPIKSTTLACVGLYEGQHRVALILWSADSILGTIEAVKTVADLFSPIDGTIIKINNLLEDSPENINNDPYDSGWIVKLKIENNDMSHLLSSEEYHKII